MEREEVEAASRAACEAGDHAGATTLLLEHYGDELLGFLAARLRSESEAQEAFSLLAEDVWLGLPGFLWRSSARTWAYTLARNAASRHARAPHRRGERNLAFSEHAPVSALVDRVRSRTQAYRRTDTKDRMSALREQLSDEDQMLLVLRVDRGLAWRELAQVIAGDVSADDIETISREAARLRKRFERVKEELKRLAIAEGLLEG